MSRRLWGILLLGGCIVGLAPAPRTRAEDERPPAKVEALPSDLALVARSGGSFVALRPADLLGSDFYKNLPPAMKDDFAKQLSRLDQFLGMPTADIERITIPIVSYEHEPPFVIRSLKPIDYRRWLKVLAPKFEKEDPPLNQVLEGPLGVAVILLDERTFVFGVKAQSLKALMAKADAKDTKRPHGQAIAWAAAKHHLVAGGTPADVGMIVWSRKGRVHEAENERIQPKTEARPGPKDEQPKKEAPPPPKPPANEEQIAVRLPQREAPQAEPEPRDLMAEMLAELPPEALPYKPLLLAKSAALAVDFGAESRCQCHLAFADADAATHGETALRTGLYVLREMLPLMARDARLTKTSTPKLFALIQDVQGALKVAKVQHHGAEVSGAVAVKTDAAVSAGVGAELEKIGARSAQNNLRQIGIAVHNHHGVHGMLPHSAIHDPKTGKPLLSWRVAILPYIEQDKLYKQFKLDEPWDSPNNIKLLERMPEIYATPGGDATKGLTHWRVFTGRGTVFEVPLRPGEIPPGVRMTDITDGTINTLLVVEAATGVPWTKPDELEYDAKKPLPKLGHQVPEEFHALFADGHVALLSRKLDEEMLRRLITRADGEVIDWNKVEPGQRRFGLDDRIEPRPRPEPESRPVDPPKPRDPPKPVDPPKPPRPPEK